MGYIAVFLYTAFVTAAQCYKKQQLSRTTKRSLFRGTACFLYCLPKLQMHVASFRHDSSDQMTEIMTRLSQHQCAEGLASTHLFPGWSCQSLRLTNGRGPRIKPGEEPAGWDFVLLYWASLMSGFFSGHSLLSTWEIPLSPISGDDSPLLLRSRGATAGCSR